MNMRGKLDIEKFGPKTLPEYNKEITAFAHELNINVEIFQSNIEGEIINKLYEEHDKKVICGAIFNPAGFTRGYPALVGAVRSVYFPTIEIHISNPAAAGVLSDFASVVKGQILGFSTYGYHLAMEGLKRLVEEKEKASANKL